METISIIVPVYNVQAYLRQCVDSILAQTYTNLEVILVDDGSTDSSGKICDEYRRLDNRVKVIHQENQGVSVARNAGMAASTGSYIGFVDGDDIVDPHFVEYLKRAMDEHGADIAYCGFRRFSNIDTTLPQVGSYKSQQIATYTQEEAFENLFSIWYHPIAVNKLTKREVIMQVFFPNFVRAEDLYFTNQTLALAKKIVGMKKSNLYHYRINPCSAMHHITAEAITSDFQARLDIYLSLYLGKYPTTAIKFANQTRRVYLDFALSTDGKKNNECKKALKKYGRLLCKKMWFPMAKNPGEYFDYTLLYCSVGLWRLFQLVKYKIFKIPIYID